MNKHQAQNEINKLLCSIYKIANWIHAGLNMFMVFVKNE